MTSIRSEECLARSGARVAEFVHLLSVLDLQIRYDFCPILVLSHPMPIPSTILISPHSVLCVSIENGKFLAHTPILHPQTTQSSQSLSISISLKSSTLCVRCSSGRRARFLRCWRWWHSGVLDVAHLSQLRSSQEECWPEVCAPLAALIDASLTAYPAPYCPSPLPSPPHPLRMSTHSPHSPHSPLEHQLFRMHSSASVHRYYH